MYLNTHSYYSLRYGTLSPEDLVDEAVKRGVKAMALTDINNTSAAYPFYLACLRKGIKPILGIEFRKDGRLLYIGLAKNNRGWEALNRFLSDSSIDGVPLPDEAPDIGHTYFIYNTLPKSITEFRKNEFFGLRPEWLNKLFSSSLREHLDKMVVHAPVTFLGESGLVVHRLLRAIDKNVLLSRLEVSDCAKSNEVLRRESELLKLYERYPIVIENTERIIQSVDIQLVSSFDNNRRYFTGSKKDDLDLLKKLALTGCIRRYGKGNERAVGRVLKELAVIEKMKFASYFLITWDIIRYAQSSGFHHIGRGSGANSIVAYCMYITDVDPIELDLYFERFINPYRTSPPDFDIDFSWDERDDVTDYIFKRYGRDHVALLATYNTFKGKSIIRELGKVFGLSKEDMDIMVKFPWARDRHHPLAKDIIYYGKMIEGFPNYLGIHAGGVLITEESIYNFTALQMMPKGFAITQFDMYGAEDLGLHKFDILSQRGLGHIKDAVELIHRNTGRHVDIRNVEAIKNDEVVKSQLMSGNCLGCFYIESPAMRGLLKKLKCDNYVSLVAASSIIRPGVAKSGMMKEYIRRFHHPNSFSYMHPVFRENLEETYGVMVYQEDVLKICHHFAGLDLDESDVLRRIMTGKKKSSQDFLRIKQKFFRNCSQRGYTEKVTGEVWRQIESFSGYSFSKAHSASYAVESFQSLYLKAYHPLEFMVAVINNFGGFYTTEVYIHEARMAGGNIHAPDINHSEYLTTLDGRDVYIGLIHLHQLERKTAFRIVKERNSKGQFSGLDDFVNRVEIAGDQLEILIRIGAFRFTGANKYELMWEKNAVFNKNATFSHVDNLLFEPQVDYNVELPTLVEGDYDQFFDELELLGFPLLSPFDAIEAPPKLALGSAQMLNYVGKTVNMVGYYVARKNVRTVNKKLMNFGTWIDREGVFFDTVHFPESLTRFPFKGRACYLLTGKISVEYGHPSLEVLRMEKLPYVKDARY